MATSPQDIESLEAAQQNGEHANLGLSLSDDQSIESALFAVRKEADPDGRLYLPEFVLVPDFRFKIMVTDQSRQHGYNAASQKLAGTEALTTVKIKDGNTVSVEDEEIDIEEPDVKLVFNGLMNYRGHTHLNTNQKLRPGIRGVDFTRYRLFMPEKDPEEELLARSQRLRDIMKQLVENKIAVTTGKTKGTIYAWSPLAQVVFSQNVVSFRAKQRVSDLYALTLREKQREDQRLLRVAEAARQARRAVREAERQEAARLQEIAARLEKKEAARAALAEKERIYQETRHTRRTPPPPVRRLVDTRAQQLLAEVRKSDERRSVLVEEPHELTLKEEKEVKRLIRSQRRNEEAFSSKTIERAVVRIICEGTEEVELPKLKSSDRSIIRKSIPVALAKDKQPGWERRLKLLHELEARIWPPVETEE